VNAIASLPQKVGQLNQVGVDDVIDMVVSGDLTGTLLEALNFDARLTIRRLFTLADHQRARLNAMTDEELHNFIDPVLKLLASAHPEKLRLVLEYGITAPGFVSIIRIVIVDL